MNHTVIYFCMLFEFSLLLLTTLYLISDLLQICVCGWVCIILQEHLMIIDIITLHLKLYNYTLKYFNDMNQYLQNFYYLYEIYLIDEYFIDEPKISCVALRPYMEPNIITSSSPSSDLRELVTSPCRGYPCGSSRVCSVSRCPDAQCAARRCLPGCPLGEASHYIVPEGTLVRVPMDGAHGQQKGCLKICKCGSGEIL